MAAVKKIFDGLTASQRYYRKHRAACAERNKRCKLKNPDVIRKRLYRQKYGITIEDYNLLIEQQGGCCAICGSTEPKGRGPFFQVDHCHVTNRVRGLLCGPCNRGIGYLQDNPTVMRRAASYVEANQI